MNEFKAMTKVATKMEIGPMKKRTGKKASHSTSFIRRTVTIMMCVATGLLFSAQQAVADESVCARVKIEIKQEVTLERQGFDAYMRINNGLADMPLENVRVTVHFADDTGAAVLASPDPDNTDALFFIRIDSLENISSVDGTGSVAPESSADIHWLIIPAPGASNGLETGKMYMVGATVTYTAAGEENTTVVAPDYIFVKPMPELTLDYFLPERVYGDDAFTPEIEPEIPFSLGLRVINSGSGIAHNFKIDSAKPKIVENNQDLLFAIQITGSTVDDEPVTPSLQVDFGSIEAGAASVARWVMTCSLSGEFVDFSAQYSHSDELGGELTSLIDHISTHLLIHDVLVDVGGRDHVRDFLARDAESLIRVYESEGIDTEVTDQSEFASLDLSVSPYTYDLDVPQTAGFMYVQRPDPFNGLKEVGSIVRSDGKVIPSQNVWLSKTRTGTDNSWEYFFNIFDANTAHSYRVIFQDPVEAPDPPVLEPIPDYETIEGRLDPVSFVVTASDPDGTIPVLSSSPQPAGATFELQGDGTGIFTWEPQVGQAGAYPMTFYASDGQHSVSRDMTITVFSAGDSDGDGYDDDEELALGSDPSNWDSQPFETTVALAKGFNLIGIPADTTVQPDMAQWLPILGDSTVIDKVMVYDHATGKYETLIPESGTNPAVTLQPGGGMIVYAKGEKTVTFTSRLCAAIDLQPGPNLLGFACAPDGYTAFELLQALGSEDAISIQSYDLETGKFKTAGFTETGQLYGDDFAIILGEGYYLYMQNAISAFEVE